jgi:hypothetical protein
MSQMVKKYAQVKAVDRIQASPLRTKPPGRQRRGMKRGPQDGSQGAAHF